MMPLTISFTLLFSNGGGVFWSSYCVCVVVFVKSLVSCVHHREGIISTRPLFFSLCRSLFKACWQCAKVSIVNSDFSFQGWFFNISHYLYIDRLKVKILNHGNNVAPCHISLPGAWYLSILFSFDKIKLMWWHTAMSHKIDLCIIYSLQPVLINYSLNNSDAAVNLFITSESLLCTLTGRMVDYTQKAFEIISDVKFHKNGFFFNDHPIHPQLGFILSLSLTFYQLLF